MTRLSGVALICLLVPTGELSASLSRTFAGSRQPVKMLSGPRRDSFDSHSSTSATTCSVLGGPPFRSLHRWENTWYCDEHAGGFLSTTFRTGVLVFWGPAGRPSSSNERSYCVRECRRLSTWPRELSTTWMFHLRSPDLH